MIKTAIARKIILIGDVTLSLWKAFRECYKRRALENLEERVAHRQNRINFSIQCFPLKNGRILDVGSADGLLLEMLGVNNAIGSDISVGYCRKMKRKGISVVNCVAEYLPFVNKTFDTITCTEVLEHVLYPRSVINEIYRVLRKGAYVFFSVPYRENIDACTSCKWKFAHLRSFDEKFVQTLSDMFTVTSVKFFAFRITFIRFYNAFINRFLSVMWKIQSLRSFFVNYHRHMKFLNITRYIRPTYMLILAVKKL